MDARAFVQEPGLQKLWSRNATLFMAEMFGVACRPDLKRLFGLEFAELYVSENDFVDVFCLQQEKDAVVEHIARRLEQANGIGEFFEDIALPIFEKFVEKTTDLPDYSSATNLAELERAYTEFCHLLNEFFAPVYFVFFAELAVEDALTKKLSSLGELDSLSTISTPPEKTAVVNERKELLQLKMEGATDLSSHTAKWNWFPCYNPSDEPYNLAHFENEYKEIRNAEEEYNAMISEEQKHRERYDRLLEKADPKLRVLMEITNKLGYYREYRTDIRREANRNVKPLFDAIGVVFSLSARDVCYMLQSEVQESLRRGKLVVSKERIQIRQKAYVMLCSDEVELLENTRDINEIKDQISQSYDSRTSLTGKTGCGGKAKGTAVIIDSMEKLNEVKQGDILVASMTATDYVPAMKRAAAIVTDEGGITCHAAVIARELGKPCLIGTGTGTKVFKDGDSLEVDANEGVVRLLGG